MSARPSHGGPLSQRRGLLPHSTLIFLLFAFPCSLLAQRPSAREQFFFDSANRERLAQQLPPLKWNSELAEAARQHALLMAKQDDLSHQLPGEPPLAQRAGEAGARFSELGENIAVGPRVQAIHPGWIPSPGHPANFLALTFQALGIACV